jgi:hypothetical protein
MTKKKRTVKQKFAKPVRKPVILPFKVKVVDKMPDVDYSVGGMNKFAARYPRERAKFPYPEYVVTVKKGLKKDSRIKTIRHEQAEATILATFNRPLNKPLDYKSAHLLTNRLDRIYGNAFRYTKSKKRVLGIEKY